jgi:hypothetical protein
VKTLSQFDPSLVVDIYQAVYGYLDEDSEQKTNIGNSGILSLTSNRRQDYQGSWFQLQEAAPDLLAQQPVAGTQAVARALLGYVNRERRSGRMRTIATYEPLRWQRHRLNIGLGSDEGGRTHRLPGTGPTAIATLPV